MRFPELKFCNGCGVGWPLDCFFRKCGGRSGLRGKCKACVLGQDSLWKKKNRAKVVQYATNWAKANPERARSKNNEATARWKAKNREKRIAQHKISNAIRDNKIVRQPCVVCKRITGVEVKAQAHHSDYNKPFDVMWLCSKHHRAWHRLFLATQLGE